MSEKNKQMKKGRKQTDEGTDLFHAGQALFKLTPIWQCDFTYNFSKTKQVNNIKQKCDEYSEQKSVDRDK